MIIMIDRIHHIVLVAIGGIVGSVSRYLVGNLFHNYKYFPFGTLVVNALGSFALGALVALYQLGIIQTAWISLFGVGYMGSFTTMSTFSIETIDLTENSYNLAITNTIIMIVVVLIAAFLGRAIAVFFFNKPALN